MARTHKRTDSLARGGEYPQIQVIMGDRMPFMSFGQAARQLGDEEVTIGTTVREGDGTEHPVSPEEQAEIERLAQEWRDMQ